MRRSSKQIGGPAGKAIASRLQGTLAAISLASQVSLITAIANDLDYDMIFAQQVYGLGRAGDVLLAISTSGNSKNVSNAVIVAKAFGLKVNRADRPRGWRFRAAGRCGHQSAVGRRGRNPGAASAGLSLVIDRAGRDFLQKLKS